MRDKHPIDDLFRETLRNASAEPPPHLAEAVIGAAQQRRRAFGWFRRRYVLGGLLLLTAGAVGYWQLRARVGNGDPSFGEPSIAHSPTPLEAETPTLSDAKNGEHPVGTITTKTDAASENGGSTTRAQKQMGASYPDLTNEGLAASVVSPNVEGVKEQHGRTLVEPVEPTSEYRTDLVVPDPAITTLVPASPADGVGTYGTSSALLTSGTVLADAAPMRLWPRFPSQQDAVGLPVAAIIHPAYVLPRGDWWIGAHSAFYASHREWSGGSGVLSDALNESEAWTSTIGLGLMGGRAWRSGFGVSSGVESERSEQAYRHVDKATSYESVVNTQMVTLNTQVYYTTVDTVITPTIRERVSAGSDTRTTWRIPVEASWRTRMGRWVLGARCGFAAEFTRARASASLINDDALGGISSAELPPTALSERYPFSMVGVLGADVGFLLHERWIATASPIYMRGLFNATSANSVSSSPERAGVRLQLCYTL